MFANRELNDQLRRINALIDKAKTFEPDDELRSHLAKYLCVLCSGFIENAIYHVLNDIVKRNCPAPVVQSYMQKQLYGLQNTNTKKLKNVITSFNDNWWNNGLHDYLQNENRASAINYIFTERHNIAHGRDSIITIEQLEGYLDKAIQVIRYCESDLETIE